MIRRFMLMALVLALILATLPTQVGASPHYGGPSGGCVPTVQQHGCSVFLAANDEMVLAGNNEDWKNPFTKLWFIPPTEGTFGQMYVGFDNYYPQGGMNDQGLFFDGLAVPDGGVVPPDTDKPDIPADMLSIVMATCADVQCVVDYANAHDRILLTNAQLFFGDASGDAVIIEPVDMIRKSGDFLVSTNFFQSATPPDDITCDRYLTAQAMLEDANGIFDVELFRQVLDATHQEGDYPTQYSNIYDLNAGIMYLYLFHDFEQVVEINLAEELALGEHEYDIPSLFAENKAQAIFSDVGERRYRGFLMGLGYDPDLETSGFAAYVGRYAIPQFLIAAGVIAAEYFEISLGDDGLLYYELPGDVVQPMPLYPTSPTTFIASSYDVEVILFTIEIQLDTAGQVTGIQGDFGGATPIVFERMP